MGDKPLQVGQIELSDDQGTVDRADIERSAGAGTHSMKINIGPDVQSILGSDPNPQGREIEIPSGVLTAEREFYALLPILLRDARDSWVFVASDGTHSTETTQDDAELAALSRGYSEDEFVVRFVSELELAE